MPRYVIIDIETRSQLDLRKVGAARYARDPSTDVWCVGYAIDDDPVWLWLPSDPVPTDLAAVLADPDYLIIAHNAAFERAILTHILTPRYGWPDIPLARWRCTMTAALALALPAALDKVAAVLGLPQQKANKTIVSLMAKPRRPRGDEDPAAGPYWFDDKEHLQALYDYCRQDVETERELYQRLPPLLPAEQELWQLDQTINDRGFYTDGLLIEKAIAITMAADRAVQAEIKQITGGEIETTNQVDKLTAWLAVHGCIVEDLQKGTLHHALRRKDLAPEAHRVIELRLEAAHASANKAASLQAWRCHDGRVRGAFQFHGASTGRWVAHGPQPQNFRRETENTAEKVAAVMTGNIETVRQNGAPIEIVGDIARAAIAAPPGRRLLTGDFSGIESRVLAWIVGEPTKLAQWAKFDRAQDPADHPYVILGSPLDRSDIKAAHERGKPIDLSFGYQGGIPAFKGRVATATDAEAWKAQQDWRTQHPETVQFWKGIDQHAIRAVHNPGTSVRYGRLTFLCEQLGNTKFLFLTLPSGRRLSYPFARIIHVPPHKREIYTSQGWVAKVMQGHAAVEYMDVDATTKQWTPCNRGKGAYGGIWTENVVQAIARDLLAAAMARLEAAGYLVVLHVHDEIVCELPDNEGSRDEFKYLIERLPEWAA